MGEIYLARLERESGFAKAVVIKRILPQYSDDPAFVEMFTREARIAAQLSHQNVVQIFDHGQHGGAYFIAMEYVHGRDLRTLLEAARERDAEALPLPVVMAILTAAARGLSYAHRCRDLEGRPLNIIHRDVSPQNILISYEGEIKLTDFGLARDVDDDQVESGQVQGKFAYMSPEQTFGYELDARSDLFSLGIVAYELFTGRRPFEGDSTRELVRAIRAGEYTLATAHRPELPQALDAVLAKALAVAVDDRYDDVRALLAELEPIARSHTGQATEAAVGGLVAALCPEVSPPATPGGSTLVSQQPIGANTLERTMPAALPVSGTSGTVPASTPITATVPGADVIVAPTDPDAEEPDASEPTATEEPDVAPTDAAPPREPPSPTRSPEPPAAPRSPEQAPSGDIEEDRSPPPGRWIAPAAVVLVACGAAAAILVTWGGREEPHDWTIDIKAEPTHAKVEVDGQPRGVTPTRVERIPGGRTVQILIKHDGYKPHVRNLELDAERGGTIPVNVKLEPQKTLGHVLLGVEPRDARVVVQGEALTVPVEAGRYRITRQPGEIQVEVTAPHHFPRSETLEVPADSTLRHTMRLTPHPVHVEVVTQGRLIGGGEVTIEAGDRFKSTCGLPCSAKVPYPGPISVLARVDGADPWRATRTGRPGATVRFEVPTPQLPKREAAATLRGYVVRTLPDGEREQSGFGEINLTRDASGFRRAGLKSGPNVSLRYAYDGGSRKVTFTLASDPWSNVTFNGAPAGQTPLVNRVISAGKHTIRLTNHNTTVYLSFKQP